MLYDYREILNEHTEENQLKRDYKQTNAKSCMLKLQILDF